MKFIGIGSDLMVMMERAAAAVEKQRVNASHDWTPAPLNCAADKNRSDAFWDLLRQQAPFVGSILTDGSYEATRAVRPAPVVLIDCFREGLDTPAAPQPGLALPRRPRSPARPHQLRRPQGHPDDRCGRSRSRRRLGRRSRPQRRGGARRQGRMLVQGLARAQHRARAPLPRRQGAGRRHRAPLFPAVGARRDRRRGRFRDGLDRQLLSGRGTRAGARKPRVAAGRVQEAGEAVSPSR